MAQYSIIIYYKNGDKSRFIYSSYGIVFNGVGSWSFRKYLARNVATFGVNNSSPSQADNRKDNFF